MERHSSTPVAVLGASIALGLLGALLFDTGLGLNAPLFALAAAATYVVLRRRQCKALDRLDRLLLAGVVVWPAVLAWRDSAGVVAIASAALALTLYLGYLRAARGDISRMPVSLPLASIAPALHGLAAAPHRLLLNDVDWTDVRCAGAFSSAGAAVRGLALSVPVALIFGTLLVSADARFESMAISLIDIDAAAVARTLLAFIACTWLAAGSFRVGVLGAPATVRSARDRQPTFGAIEVLIVLAVLDLLFASYVAVQFTYFFGGDALVREAGALTYAQYARRGFFELVILAALVVPLLLTAQWMVDKVGRRSANGFRWLAGAMIVMVVVIELSAAHRMLMYTEAFGLTTARLYTSTFMGWLLLVLGWFAATVLRSNRERFMPGTLAAALAVSAALIVSNPDATIASTNLERGARGHRVDVQYLLSLSDDALPTIMEARARLSHRARQALDMGLEQRASERSDQGWRELNVARARAAHLLEEHQASRRGKRPGELQ